MPDIENPHRLRIGEGYISANLSILFSLVSLGGVLCFRFPANFTTPEFRAVYPVELLRWVLFACIVASFAFAFVSFLLSRRPRLALGGILVSAFAIVLGGTGVEIEAFDQSINSISLDWLLIDIVILSVIFIPIELFLPQRRDQSKFHPEWKTDAVYFAISHLLI